MKYGLAGFLAILIVVVLIFALKIQVHMAVMAVLAIAAVVVLIVPVMYVKRTEASFDGSALHVKGSNVDLSIPLEKIHSIEFRDSLNPWKLVNGSSNGWMVGGTFTNPEFRKYTITANCDLKAFIIVRYSGKVLVFNLRTEDETSTLCDTVNKSLPDNPRRH